MNDMKDDVICPHCLGLCNRPHVTDDDYHIDDECPHCGRLFHIEVVVVKTYRTSIIDFDARRAERERVERYWAEQRAKDEAYRATPEHTARVAEELARRIGTCGRMSVADKVSQTGVQTEQADASKP